MLSISFTLLGPSQPENQAIYGGNRYVNSYVLVKNIFQLANSRSKSLGSFNNPSIFLTRHPTLTSTVRPVPLYVDVSKILQSDRIYFPGTLSGAGFYAKQDYRPLSICRLNISPITQNNRFYCWLLVHPIVGLSSIYCRIWNRRIPRGKSMRKQSRKCMNSSASSM